MEMVIARVHHSRFRAKGIPARVERGNRRAALTAAAKQFRDNVGEWIPVDVLELEATVKWPPDPQKAERTYILPPRTPDNCSWYLEGGARECDDCGWNECRNHPSRRT